MVDAVLFESATGYALFTIKQAEEIGVLLESMQESIQSLPNFGKLITLSGFLPFKSAEDALANINAISEGVLNEELKTFLEDKVEKKTRLGVSEDKLASAIADTLGIQCVKTKVVVEIARGIRLHFEKFIKELKEGDLAKAELGLGHSYSRSKVKFNVNRADNMIIQSICLLDQLEKDVNTFSMRVREWYSWHFPELLAIVPDNYFYARCARAIGNKAELAENIVELLTEILSDESKANQIVEASKSSMGYEISELDLISIKQFADRVIHLTEYKKRLHEYLIKKMSDIAPNLSALIGETVGARLISHAGSLTNLAKYPASTVQILGAEKALFRALKTRGNTPKYGLIYHSTFIGRAAAKNKGRISRYLANKASIASRIDCFTDVPTTKFGEILRGQVEERLNFYDSGAVPRKNLDCMREAVTEADTVRAKLAKKNKKRKSEAVAMETEEVVVPAEEPVVEETPKKKRKSTKPKVVEEAPVEETPVEMEVAEEAPKKKRKSTKPKVVEEPVEEAPMEVVEAPVSDKKKKKKRTTDED